jgi:hypothetical protein
MDSNVDKPEDSASGQMTLKITKNLNT